MTYYVPNTALASGQERLIIVSMSSREDGVLADDGPHSQWAVGVVKKKKSR